MTNGYEWVLKIEDQFSAPLKGIVTQSNQMQEGMLKNAQSIEYVEDSIGGLENKWTSFSAVINQTSEAIEKIANSLNFTDEYKSLETNLKRYTTLIGDELDHVTSKSHNLGEVFGEDTEPVEQSGDGAKMSSSNMKTGIDSVTENISPWIDGLSQVSELIGGVTQLMGNMGFDKLETVEQSGMMTFLSDMKAGIDSVTENISPWINGLLQVSELIGTVTELTRNMTIAKRAQSLWTSILTAKQWLLNIAMKANPIMWIVTGIVGIVTAVTMAYQKIGWFRGMVQGAWEGLKTFGKIIKDHVIDNFNKLLSGLSVIGKSLKHFFSGEWDEAWEAGKEGVKEIGEAAFNLTPVGIAKKVYDNSEEIGESVKKGYANGVSEVNQKKEEKKQEKFEENADSTNDYNLPGVAPSQNMGLPFNPTVDLPKSEKTIDSIATGGSKQTNLNVHIEKVLEMRDQIINGEDIQSEELIDTLVEALTRRLSGTFRSALN